jgi:ornithine cyclodeaminase/alanine dehydrogenase-like protein (mu-crystallin family)
MALQITEARVLELITPEDALSAVRRAHLALQAGRAINTVRSRSRAALTSVHTMSAIDLDGNYAAAKVYSAVGPMVSCHVLLYQASSGELLAAIEGKELGRLRTAAAPVAAAQAVAPAARSLAVIGSGFQASGVIEAFSHPASAYSFSEIRVASRHPEKARSLASAFPPGANVRSCQSAEEACSGAEIVVTATTSSTPASKHSGLRTADSLLPSALILLPVWRYHRASLQRQAR